MEHKYEYILVRYGELSTKGKNKKDFIRLLVKNVKNALSSFPDLTYQQTHDRLYIHLNGEDYDQIEGLLSKVFGISSFSPTVKVESDLDTIVEAAYKHVLDSEGKTFKIATRRNDKNFPLKSDDINRLIATQVLKNSELKVDVHNPDILLMVEIRERYTYIMSKKVIGANGYPVGVAGKSMLLLSGGIDSPVAAYLAMKRGIEIEAIHFASPPYTSSAAQNKVLKLAELVSLYQGNIKVHVVPFTELQLEIYKNCNESYAITIMRRMMVRIAEEVARKRRCLTLVTGESVGQVASQTLDSMSVINEVTKMPILRPVVTYDKLEIIDIAKKIGTYETSILPFEDCCTIFTPKNPVTKPKLDRAIKYENSFDYGELIKKCIEETEVINCTFKTIDKEKSNLF